MSAVAEGHEVRVMFARSRTELNPIFEEVAQVAATEGQDVGGDVRVAWDPDDEDQCRAVGKMFDRLAAKGFRAVKVGDDGKLKDGTTIEKFDGKIGRMVMLPQMAGGTD